MGRPKKSIQPAPVEPEAEKPEAETGSTVSKSAAARAAIEAGHDAPEQGVSYVKREFGIDMDRQHFSAVKSQMKKKAETGATPKGKPGRKPSVAKLDQVVKTIQPAVGSSVISDLAAVKALVEKLGVAEVVEIAKLFG
jgi:hypothetical protein